MVNCFYPLMSFFLVDDSEFSCLAMITKPYSMSGPIPMPQIPNHIHHEVLGTILGT